MASTRFAEVMDEEINLLLDDAVPENTKHATKYGMKVFKFLLKQYIIHFI